MKQCAKCSTYSEKEVGVPDGGCFYIEGVGSPIKANKVK